MEVASIKSDVFLEGLNEKLEKMKQVGEFRPSLENIIKLLQETEKLRGTEELKGKQVVLSAV